VAENKTSRRDLLHQTALAAGAGMLLAPQLGQAQAPPAGRGGGRGRGGAPQGPSPIVNPDASADQPWMQFYPKGFRTEKVKTSGAVINTVIGGSGPPVLFFHGAPESLIAWRLVAPDLAKEYTCVMCDLRGYGDSSKPADQPDHSSQSKRPMALDGVEVMEHLGFRQFRMVGHDRGGRVGRRMALDHPDRILKLTVLDIVPAHYLYSHVTIEFVQAYFHWFNYLQRSPIPENQLKMTNDAALATATDPVRKEFLRNNADMLTIHAMCEDYRASASIDLRNDEADVKAGKKIQCPLHVLWAANGAMGRLYDVLGIWKDEGVNVTGKGLPGGHDLQESAPKETLAELQAFLKG
jgi:haloacetate dehalogenase